MSNDHEHWEPGVAVVYGFQMPVTDTVYPLGPPNTLTW
jgi:hypothetical protein